MAERSIAVTQQPGVLPGAAPETPDLAGVNGPARDRRADFAHPAPIDGELAGLNSSFGPRLTESAANRLVEGLQTVNPQLHAALTSLPPDQRLQAVSLLLDQNRIGVSHEIVHMREIGRLEQKRDRLQQVKEREAEIIRTVYGKDPSEVTEQERINPPAHAQRGPLQAEWRRLRAEEKELVRSALGYAEGSRDMRAG